MAKKPAKLATKEPAPKPSNRRGKMKEFTPDQVVALATILRSSEKRHAKRDYALMCVSVDMMARTSDILRLTFGDVLLNGEVVEEMQFQQKKTGELASCVFSEPARAALAAYIGKFAESVRADKSRRLFPFSGFWYRSLVKEWATLLRLDPSRYSGHSFRRTKAKMIYAQTKNIIAVKELLGHRDQKQTQEYLDIDRADALELARQISPLK